MDKHVRIEVPNTASLCLNSHDFSHSSYSGALVSLLRKELDALRGLEIYTVGDWHSKDKNIRVMIALEPDALDAEGLERLKSSAATIVKKVFAATPLWNKEVLVTCSLILAA